MKRRSRGTYNNLAANLNIQEFIETVKDRPAIWSRFMHCNKSFVDEAWEELSKIHNVSIQTLKSKWKGLRDNFRVEFKRIPRAENGDLLIDPIDHDTKWYFYKSLVFLADHMRSREPKLEQFDDYYYEVLQRPQQQQQLQQHMQQRQLNDITSDYDEDNSCSFMSEGLIQIPDEIDLDDEDDDDDPMHYNMNEINMATLETNDGCAASFAEPILNSDVTTTRQKPGPKCKKEGTNSVALQLPDVPSRLSPEEADTSKQQPSHNTPVDQMDDDYHFLMSLHPYMTELNASQKLRMRMKIQKLVFKELYKDDDEAE